MIVWIGVAWAGIGDPIDGQPSWEERTLHLWSNAVRSQPSAFLKDYQSGGCDLFDFAESERLGAGKMSWNAQLSQAALAHADDLAATGTWSHNSSDGTPMAERIQEYYGSDKPFAENLARGYTSGRSAVLTGWMCSPGHRHNLLDARWDEVGHGWSGGIAAQNLGRGQVTVARVPVAVHEPEVPDGAVSIWVDTWGETPDAVSAVVDGVRVYGRQVYGGNGGDTWVIDHHGDGRCTPWFVEVDGPEGTTRWPEEGSYGWGRCTWDDERARWLGFQVEEGDGPTDTDPWGEDTDVSSGDPEEDTDGEVDVIAWSALCSSLGGGMVLGPVWILVAGAARRRRPA